MSGPSPARRLSLPLVPLYRLGLVWREWRLRTGREPVRRLGWPVISIGNLSTGGAGKTPLTIALARALAVRELRVDVLSRGYGRTGTGAARVDQEGRAEQFGDEPLVIAREAGLPVYVATERYEAGLLAEREHSRQGVHLLDDGFQHRQLHRDVNILLLSARDLHDHLLPAGNLREPLSAIRRADVVAIPVDEPELESAVKKRGFAGPIWRLRRRMEVPPIAGPVVAFCGIARPGQFFAGLEAAGLHVASRVKFRDHHRYMEHDIDCLRDAARSVKATASITTEKDRVRLGAMAQKLETAGQLITAQLRVEIEEEQRAMEWTIAQIQSAASA